MEMAEIASRSEVQQQTVEQIVDIKAAKVVELVPHRTAQLVELPTTVPRGRIWQRVDEHIVDRILRSCAASKN